VDVVVAVSSGDRERAPAGAGDRRGGVPVRSWWLRSTVPTGASSATRPAIERVRGSALSQPIWPGAGHEVSNETNRDEVIAEVVEFLSGRAW